MSEVLNNDVENRVFFGKTKRDVSNGNLPQASKRAALGTITSNVLRVQPFRTAKQAAPSFDFCCQGEPPAAAPTILPQRKPLLKEPATSFTIHHDPPQPSKLNVEESVENRLRIHPGVLGLQRQPLALIPIKREVDVDEETRLVLDESFHEDRLNEARHQCWDNQFTPEYVQDVYKYLREAEPVESRSYIRTTHTTPWWNLGHVITGQVTRPFPMLFLIWLNHRPKPFYLRKQPDITLSMRSVLVDWLVEVGEEYKLETETLHLAVNYMDRFLSSMSVLRDKLQLVGTACMFVASKFEEIYPPDAKEFVYITDDTYTKKQVLRMEHLILKVLAFDLSVPTAYCYIQRFCKLGRVSEMTEFLAYYLSELTLLEAEPYLGYLPSIIAASALYLAQYVCGDPLWEEEMQTLTGYSVADFRDCVLHLHKTMRAASSYPQQAVCEKYRSQKYLVVSDMNPPDRLPFDGTNNH